MPSRRPASAFDGIKENANNAMKNTFNFIFKSENSKKKNLVLYNFNLSLFYAHLLQIDVAQNSVNNMVIQPMTVKFPTDALCPSDPLLYAIPFRRNEKNTHSS